MESKVSDKEPCPKCREGGRDRSGDNLVRWADGGATCFACGYKEYKSRAGDKEVSKLTLKQVQSYSVGVDPDRMVDSSIAATYDVRASWDGTACAIDSVYYPYYDKGEMIGAKVRHLGDKSFKVVGKLAPVFGKQACEGSKILIITEGEEDTLATKQMLMVAPAKNYDVVSLQSASGVKAACSDLEFFESYPRIFICLDNDEPGRAAAEELADFLSPVTEVRVASLDKAIGKDASDYLVAGKVKEFRDALSAAQKYEPEGVVNGKDILLDDLLTPLPEGYTIPFPGLQDKLHGLRRAEIVTLCAGCVDADTEYLSPNGWVRIADYEGGPVMQYSEDGNGSFVTPQQYHVYHADELTRVKTKYGVDQVLSDTHNVVYWNRGWPNKQSMSFGELKEKHMSRPNGWHGRFRTTFDYSGKGVDIDEGNLRLQVAVNADGRVVREGKDNYTQMRFAKERKYLRLINLCQKFGLSYDDRSPKLTGNKYEVIVWPKYKDKDYSQFWAASKEQLGIILDEMRYWDGDEGGKFFSTCKESIGIIQYAYAVHGVRSTVSVDSRSYKYLDGWHGVVVPSRNSTVGITNRHGEKCMEPYKTVDGKMYCFTVPTGMLVLRRNGCIFITGNSGVGKSTLCREMAKSLIEQGCSVANVALEDQMNVTAQAMIALDMDIPLNRFRFNPPPKEDVQPHYDKMVANGKTFFYKHFGGLNSDNLINRLNYYAKSKKCDFIILDHLSMVVAASKETNERQAIDHLMDKLSKLVVETGVGLIQVVHLKRPSGDKSFAKGGEVELSDLRGSASLEQYSWAVVGLERDQQGEDRDFSRVRLLKNRTFGFTGLCDTLKYNASTGRLEHFDLETDNPPEGEDEKGIS